MIICSFSDWKVPLDEVPKCLKGKKLHDWILKNLSARERVSVWEINTNMRVCRTLMFLKSIGKVRFNDKFDYPYQGIDVVRGEG